MIVYNIISMLYTILSLIEHMKKNNFETHNFLVKVVNCSYINVMRISEKLISYVKVAGK